jgi:hypothetical protein
MVEFRGVVNFDNKGELVCFCSYQEVLQGKCACRQRDDCPEALITVEVIEGTRPSEQIGTEDVRKVSREMLKGVSKIKEGLAKFEKDVKWRKFRI